MTAMARRNDPKSSHRAAGQLISSGAHGNQKLIARALVKKFPGSTYRFLYAKHQQQCRRAGCELIFQDAPSLMRRLSEVAVKRGEEYCPISNRQVVTWWPE